MGSTWTSPCSPRQRWTTSGATASPPVVQHPGRDLHRQPHPPARLRIARSGTDLHLLRGPRDPQLEIRQRAGVVPLGRDRQQPQPLRRADDFRDIGTQIHQAKRCVHRIKAVAEGDQTAMPLQSQNVTALKSMTTSVGRCSVASRSSPAVAISSSPPQASIDRPFAEGVVTHNPSSPASDAVRHVRFGEEADGPAKSRSRTGPKQASHAAVRGLLKGHGSRTRSARTHPTSARPGNA